MLKNNAIKVEIIHDIIDAPSNAYPGLLSNIIPLHLALNNVPKFEIAIFKNIIVYRSPSTNGGIPTVLKKLLLRSLLHVQFCIPHYNNNALDKIAIAPKVTAII